MKKIKLVIFETHPIQYRVPVYQKLNKLRPDSFEVVFGSDFSVQGYEDPGFQTNLRWDVPLLEGYAYSILNPRSKVAPRSWMDLPAPHLFELLQQCKPHAVLLTSLSYRFNAAAYFSALRLGIPIWLRLETQDYAFERSFIKAFLRSSIYRALYYPVKKAFPIGQLNRKHYLNHGLHEQQLHAAHYCTPNPLQDLTYGEKLQLRQLKRKMLDLSEDDFLVAFFGKFIPKKDPELVFKALPHLSDSLRKKITLVFVGSGDLQNSLQSQADTVQTDLNVCSHFAGFINQSQLPAWYLAADLLILPSRQMGETWGLVVNEALQAGCGVIISEFVGCHADFGTWERVRTIPVGNPLALAEAISDLSSFPRSFNWAESQLKNYSIDAAAESLAQAIDTLS